MYFFRNITTLILCYLYACIRGKARTTGVVPHTVIIIPASRLGDMVCATPIFYAIKQKYPGCKVIVAGWANCAAIHEHNPDVDKYLTIPDDNFWDNIKKIRATGADTAILTTPSFQAIALLYLAGVRTIIGPRVVNGFCPYQTRSYRMMMPLFIQIDHRMRQYAPREYLYMLEPLGIEADDTKKHIGFSDTAQQKMRSALVEQGIALGTDLIIGISISAGNKIKKWPGTRFAAVADILAARHKAAMVFIGGPGDVEETSGIVARLAKGTRYVDMTGRCSIDELKALMSYMSMFISVDTGPIYVAEALNIPTVDITGPIDELEQPPIGPRHKVVYLVDRKGPELFVMNARVYNESEARRQTEGITVESVIVVTDALIHDVYPSR